jgi:hypothetical protein
MLAACSSSKPATDNAQSNMTAATPTPSPTPSPTAPSLNAADRAAVNAAVDAIYATYRRPPAVGPDAEDADWDRLNYSTATKTLIARWKGIRVEGEIVSMLEEAGWFCQCQDWFGKGFAFLDKTFKPLPNGQIEADIRFDLGDGMAQKARIIFVREGTEWKVSDLFTPALPKGLVAQMNDDLTEQKKK